MSKDQAEDIKGHHNAFLSPTLAAKGRLSPRTKVGSNAGTSNSIKASTAHRSRSPSLRDGSPDSEAIFSNLAMSTAINVTGPIPRASARPSQQPPSAAKSGPPVASVAGSEASSSQVADAVAMADAAIESARLATSSPRRGGGGGSSSVPASPVKHPRPGTAEYVKNSSIANHAMAGVVSPPVGVAGVGGAGAAQHKTRPLSPMSQKLSGSGFQQQRPSLVSASSSHSVSHSISRRSKSPSPDLDLKHNDNAFHVVANLVTERIEQKLPPGATSYTLDQDDHTYFDQMLPMTVRRSFVDALRYRLNMAPPENSGREGPLHILERRCEKLGLGREDYRNPLLSGGQGGVVAVENIPPNLSIRGAGSGSVAGVPSSSRSVTMPTNRGAAARSSSAATVTGHPSGGRHYGRLSPQQKRLLQAQEEQQRELERKELMMREQEIRLAEQQKRIQEEQKQLQEKELERQREMMEQQQNLMKAQMEQQQQMMKAQMEQQQLQMRQQQQILEQSLKAKGEEKELEKKLAEQQVKIEQAVARSMSSLMAREAQGDGGTGPSTSGLGLRGDPSGQGSGLGAPSGGGLSVPSHAASGLGDPSDGGMVPPSGGGTGLEAPPPEPSADLSPEEKAAAAAEAEKAAAESLARQQIMAELKEAQKLMADSVTTEASSFWKAHVMELQARLRALNGDEPAAAESEAGQPSLGGAGSEDESDTRRDKIKSMYEGPQITSREAYLENNRRMAAEHRDRDLVTADVDAVVQDASVVTRSRSASVGGGGFLAPKASMVEVVAPADLPPGYTFEAQMGSKRFLAVVPDGGVRKGEVFACPMRELSKVQIEAPVGGWRDELFDCFKNGVFHPLVLNTIFCPLVALGQVMTRSRLNWKGNPSFGLESESAFVTMWLTVAFWVVMNGMAISVLAVNWERGAMPSSSDFAAVFVINISIVLFAIWTVKRTRQSIRNKYGIPEQRCFDHEDCMCATFCMPCTICQMGRHTADFDTYLGACCTDTGLPKHVTLAAIPGASSNNDKSGDNADSYQPLEDGRVV